MTSVQRFHLRLGVMQASMRHDSLKSDSCLRRWARPGRLASACQSYHGGADSEPELASDARLVLLAQNTLRDPIAHQEKG